MPAPPSSIAMPAAATAAGARSPRSCVPVETRRRPPAAPTHRSGHPAPLPAGALQTAHCFSPRPAAGTQQGAELPLLPLLLAIVLASAVAPLLRRPARHRQREARDLLRAEIDRQASGLRIRRMQLLGSQGRGAARRQRWEREKQRFCDTRLRAVLAKRGLDRLWPALRPAMLRRVEHAARRRRKAPAGFDPAMHPLDYERFCATLLERAGWSTRLTPASGDQGADILARRGRCRLVVQCKLYSGAVGNDAVQQVAAARAHQGAQAAIVVSNARFTASARALARSNRVALLHHEELAAYRPDRAPSDTIASATW